MHVIEDDLLSMVVVKDAGDKKEITITPFSDFDWCGLCLLLCSQDISQSHSQFLSFIGKRLKVGWNESYLLKVLNIKV